MATNQAKIDKMLSLNAGSTSSTSKFEIFSVSLWNINNLELVKKFFYTKKKNNKNLLNLPKIHFTLEIALVRLVSGHDIIFMANI